MSASDSPVVRSRVLSRVALPQSPRARWSTVTDVAADEVMRAEVAAAASVTALRRDQLRGSPPWVGSVDEMAAWDPAVLAACRWPSSRVGMPNYLGWLPVPSPSGRVSVLTESLHERHSYVDYIETADAGPHGPVVAFASQPCLLTWGFEDGVRSHFPDALALHADGTRVLIDVTRQAKLSEPAALAVFWLTAATARAARIGYQVRTEMPVQRSVNVRFLWSYRLETSSALMEKLVEGLPEIEWPITCFEAAARLGGGAAGLGRLWRLVSRGRLFVDLNRPLTPASWVDANPPVAEAPRWVVSL